jgi:hypothetical protein
MIDDEGTGDAETLVERALRVRSQLQSSEKTSIRSLYKEFPELWQLLHIELNWGGRGADPELAHALRFSVSFLNKFIKEKSSISMRDARMLADRLVTYLRSESHVGQFVPNAPPGSPPTNNQQPEKPFTVAAVEWRSVRSTHDLQNKIDEVVRTLNEVVVHATTSNLPLGHRALTEIERAQLIAVLRTVLKMLEAPMIEKGLLKKAGTMLKRAASKAVEKQVESAFAFAAGYAAGQLTSLLPHL